MSSSKSIFHGEWRNCLREHYLHVIRHNDTITEPSLRQVLMDIGFTEADIDSLKNEALKNENLQPNPSSNMKQNSLF